MANTKKRQVFNRIWEIKELYSALQRFIEGRQKMHIPLEQDDDDVIIASAFDELEKLREENKRLREEIRQLPENIKEKYGIDLE